MSVDFSDHPMFRAGGFSAPTRFEADIHDVEVEGEIPSGIHGVWYRMACDFRYQRIDLSSGAASTYFVGDVQGLQECCFVPRSAAAAEGDGYLIGVVNNYGEHKSDLVVVDAQALDKGAIATLKLPFRLRPGAHGTWAPHEQVPFTVFQA